MTTPDPAIRQLAALMESEEMADVKPEIREKLLAIVDMGYKRHSYANEMTTAPSEVLTHITEETMNHPWEEVFKAGKTSWLMIPRMISGRVTGNFLQFVISMMKAKNVLEVGLFTGYTALTMAEVLPADGCLVSCEVEEYLKDLTSKFFSRSPHGKKIQVHIAPAADTLEALGKEGRTFEVVFVDADKSGYKKYVEMILEKGLLAPNGIILADNAFFGGTAYVSPQSETSAINDFNKYICSRPDLVQVLLPIGDGILAIKRKSEVKGQDD